MRFVFFSSVECFENAFISQGKVRTCPHMFSCCFPSLGLVPVLLRTRRTRPDTL